MFNSKMIGANSSGGGPFSGNIGDTYEGGIVFYINASGGVLISAPADITNSPWKSPFGLNVDITVGDNAIGLGLQNTQAIISEYGTGSGGSYAARNCTLYTGGGYNDWHLPSMDELNQMYLNIGQGNALGLGNIGNFSTGPYEYSVYLSSSQRSIYRPWIQNFATGQQTDLNSNAAGFVRPIRRSGVW